ncbi:hypothetical protein Pelo_17359 [Pelomyxa schiedti]|nr:hypothetical protein Pelo_17359 [Pelomyxa schiedti]
MTCNYTLPVIIFQDVETPLALRQSRQYHAVLQISREWQTVSGLTPAAVRKSIWNLKCYTAPPAVLADASFCPKCHPRKRGNVRTIKVIEVDMKPSEIGEFWHYPFTIKPICCSSSSHFRCDLNIGLTLTLNSGSEVLCTSPQFSVKSHQKSKTPLSGSPHTPGSLSSGTSSPTTLPMEGIISYIYWVTTSRFDTSEICLELSSVLQDAFPQFLTSFRVGMLTPPSLRAPLQSGDVHCTQAKDSSPTKGTPPSTQQIESIPSLAGMMISITLTFRASSHAEAREFRARILDLHTHYLSNEMPERMENYTGSDLIHTNEWKFIEEKFYYYDCTALTEKSTPSRTDTPEPPSKS